MLWASLRLEERQSLIEHLLLDELEQLEDRVDPLLVLLHVGQIVPAPLLLVCLDIGGQDLARPALTTAAEATVLVRDPGFELRRRDRGRRAARNGCGGVVVDEEAGGR